MEWSAQGNRHGVGGIGRSAGGGRSTVRDKQQAVGTTVGRAVAWPGNRVGCWQVVGSLAGRVPRNNKEYNYGGHHASFLLSILTKQRLPIHVQRDARPQNESCQCPSTSGQGLKISIIQACFGFEQDAPFTYAFLAFMAFILSRDSSSENFFRDPALSPQHTFQASCSLGYEKYLCS